MTLVSEKITDMPDAAALDGTEVAPLVQSGGNVKSTLLVILNWILGAVGLELGWASVALTSAQIKALFTTPITFILKKPGTVTWVIVSNVNLTAGAAPYGGGGAALKNWSIALKYVTATLPSWISDVLGSSTSVIKKMIGFNEAAASALPLTAYGDEMIAGQDIVITTNTTNPLVGTGTCVVSAWYLRQTL